MLSSVTLTFVVDTQKRLKIKFVTIADLMLQMEVAKSQNRLKSFFTKSITSPSLLVLDEFGYVKLNEEQANFMFQLVNKRYETGWGYKPESTIFLSNIISTCFY